MAESPETDDRTLTDTMPEQAAEDEQQETPHLTPYLTWKELVQSPRYTNLTLYERKEARKYKEIWCYGLHAKKSFDGPHNRGFDTEARSYIVEPRDHVAYRYEILYKIGQGQSSKVYKARDHKTNTIVALKLFRNDNKCRTLAENEEKLLRRLNAADTNVVTPANIIRMLDSFVFRKHHVIVMELLAESILSFMKRTSFKPLALEQVRAVARSTLRALTLLEKLRIIHGDLKPENLILREIGKTGIKLIDFGTSCLEGQTTHTYYQTRYYRAPEVLLGLPYGLPIDMWSLGCILAELATGVPLFLTANEAELMARMMEILGLLPAEMQQQLQRDHFELHFNADGTARYWTGGPHSAREIDKYNGPPGCRTLRGALGEAGKNKLFVDFMKQCLVWEPSKRMTPSQAYEHPWMKTPVRKPLAPAKHT
ncbi:Dual specificity tyrosine-phosphorylation-regulated kinase 2 [Hypsibius exemplaris]|uniref:Dual specificity tyrosine-phosphorylation-regulated kinase 2 n=1 Tax=Hypsibius exemplaris TaxID=2072580 RepID=A0A1W0WG64_HYPEX|nr:Dual specificity tyrosine-phosphorylation-regulated kinase 2 [Hypsibius exemplaris]